MTDDLERSRLRRAQRPPPRTSGTGLPSGRARAREARRVLDKVDQAAERRDPAGYYAGQKPTRERITAALNMRSMYGPEVDRALGGEEPMVDEWESGERVPSFAQVQKLAMLTGFPLRFFYMPAPPPVDNGWMCGRDGCHPLAERGDDGKCPECGQKRPERR